MKFITMLLLLFFGLIGFAKSPSEADKLFNERKYDDSADVYALLLEKRPTDPLYNYRYARCLYELQDYNGAIKYFQAAGNKYPLRDYYLADSYFMAYRFDEAVEYYNTYLTSTRVNASFTDDVIDKLRRSRIAVRLMNRVEDIVIIDSLIVNQHEFLSHYRLSKETGEFLQNSLTVNKKATIDFISFITQRGGRKIFSDTIGSKIQLYASNKLLDGWSKSESLSDNVNTTGNTVNYPFLRLDGITLFFSSEGDNSIGGYDIFITRFAANTNDYLNPENIGMPFNSLDNDYMLVIDEVNQTGWFATDRNQQKGKVMIYHFRYQDEKKYVSEEDQDNLIKAAQLKTSRKDNMKDVVIPQQSKTINDEFNNKVRVEDNNPEIKVTDIGVKRNNDGQTPEMKFQLNDQLTYTNTTQFKSTKALQLWNEWQSNLVELKKNEGYLKDIRSEFEDIQKLSDKKALTEEIITLEAFILKSRLLLDEKIKNIREEELNFINDTR